MIVTFNPCYDCGSDVWPLIVVTLVLWFVPAMLMALRNHAAPDPEHDSEARTVQVWATVVAGLITAWLVVHWERVG